MLLHTILTTIIFATSPDLCADVYVDNDGTPYRDAIGQTWSRLCEWTGPDAPVLDLDVCCTTSGDSAECSLPDGYGRCAADSKTFYCAYGEVTMTGGVVCYQPFPSICEFGYCVNVMPPDVGHGPVENGLCCWGDSTCTEIETYVDLYECATNGGVHGYCKNGAQNIDGTVDCFD